MKSLKLFVCGLAVCSFSSVCVGAVEPVSAMVRFSLGDATNLYQDQAARTTVETDVAKDIAAQLMAATYRCWTFESDSTVTGTHAVVIFVLKRTGNSQWEMRGSLQIGKENAISFPRNPIVIYYPGDTLLTKAGGALDPVSLPNQIGTRLKEFLSVDGSEKVFHPFAKHVPVALDCNHIGIKNETIRGALPLDWKVSRRLRASFFDTAWETTDGVKIVSCEGSGNCCPIPLQPKVFGLELIFREFRSATGVTAVNHQTDNAKFSKWKAQSVSLRDYVVAPDATQQNCATSATLRVGP